jgi:aminomethyltransferase
MTATLLHTPLYEWHAAHGARLVDFAGWAMPVQYGSLIEEHHATRRHAGLFDVSHMGRLRFEGPGAVRLLDGLVTRRLTDQPPGQVRYALITNERGGVIDDVLVYHLKNAAGGSYYVMVVNASNRAKVARWLDPRLAERRDVHMIDASESWAMLAVQGPKACQIVQPLLSGLDLAGLPYYRTAETQLDLAGQRAAGVVSRTGYTGEDGCELMVGAAVAVKVWELLVAGGAVPAGLGARDTLRLEAGMPLYGHELSEEIDPFQAGLDFAVDLEGRTFTGREALLERRRDASLPRRIGLVLAGRRAARQADEVWQGGERVGKVSSGSFSPTLERPIAMAYVAAQAAAEGTALEIDVRGRREPAVVAPLPFYRRKRTGRNT